jgi:ubiquinone/menaquinone biosynthesis C-methylase UbiE
MRLGDEGDLWHRALIDPALLAVVGPVRGLEILDLGCGNGYLSRRFARAGARVVGIDASVPTLEFAKGRERASPLGIRYEVSDAAHLSGFQDRSFDLVVANMSLMDIRDGGGAVREVARLLRPAGRFVFSINHPCFDVDTSSTWVTEYALYDETICRKVRGYRAEREVDVPWKISETESRFTKSYHRTLSTYVRYLREAGLAIRRLEEPFPRAEVLEKSPQGRMIAEIPLHLVVEAVPFAPGVGKPGRRGVRLTGPGSRSSARSRRGAVPRSGSPHRKRGTDSSRRGSTPGS